MKYNLKFHKFDLIKYSVVECRGRKIEKNTGFYFIESCNFSIKLY